MSKISPCLWFSSEAEEAAKFEGLKRAYEGKSAA
jgi:hypothetical protein